MKIPPKWARNVFTLNLHKIYFVIFTFQFYHPLLPLLCHGNTKHMTAIKKKHNLQPCFLAVGKLKNNRNHPKGYMGEIKAKFQGNPSKLQHDEMIAFKFKGLLEMLYNLSALGNIEVSTFLRGNISRNRRCGYKKGMVFV